MQNVLKTSSTIILALVFLACGNASKEKKADLNDKKVELQKLKTEHTKLSEQIKKLESEIGTLDTTGASAKPKLVNATLLTTQKFTHYIDLQGKVTTDNIYTVSPRGNPSQVRAIYVKEGDRVRKGQLLMKLDDAVMLQNLRQLETQLAFAKNLHQRRKNLWDQGIGTEVELISAKNEVDNLEKQISILKEQWNTSRVYSEVSGVVESVTIKVGEVFGGFSASQTPPGITIVNPNKLKAEVLVPENYISRIKKGTPVVIEIPNTNKKFNSTISLVSELINIDSRGFTAEAKIPADAGLKPNQIALVKIQDYSKSDVIVIPISTVQTDEKGKYAYVMIDEKGKKVAKKRPLMVGEIYGEFIEVKQGLSAGDQLITQGYQDLYEGQLVSTL